MALTQGLASAVGYQAKKMELEKSASSTSFFNLSVINTPPRLERSEAVRTPEAPRVVENFQSPSKGSWSNFFFSLTQGTSLSNPTPLSRGLPSAAQANSATMPSPDKAVAMLKQQLGGNQAGVEGSARRDNKTQIDVMNEGPCKGPEAVAGPSTSEDMPHRKPFAPPRRRKIQITEFPSADAKPVSVLEDAEFRNALEGYKHFLCEMMMRRGQFVERSMVVKMLQAGRPDSAINSAWTARSQLLSGIHEQMDLHMSVVCSNCGTSLAAGRRTCQECRSTRALPLCCICHRPVARLARDCALCFHGGHVQCLTKWWKNGQSCPAGCGCICPLINGGGGGGFHNLAPGIVEVAAVDQLGIGNRPTVNQRRPNTNKPSSGVRWYSDVGVSSYSPKY